jgi:hypothetical protein
MNNEPVAYLVQYKDRHEFRWKMPEHLFEALACEPLYTHPAKTLTDEEIEGCYQLWRSLSGDPAKLYQQFKLKEQEK